MKTPENQIDSILKGKPIHEPTNPFIIIIGLFIILLEVITLAVFILCILAIPFIMIFIILMAVKFGIGVFNNH